MQMTYRGYQIVETSDGYKICKGNTKLAVVESDDAAYDYIDGLAHHDLTSPKPRNTEYCLCARFRGESSYSYYQCLDSKFRRYQQIKTSDIMRYASKAEASRVAKAILRKSSDMLSCDVQRYHR